jgi:hypothetical protein
MMQGVAACARLCAGRDAEAIDRAERSVRLQPNHHMASCVPAASRAISVQLAEAQRDMARLHRLDPGLRNANLLESFPIPAAGPRRLGGGAPTGGTARVALALGGKTSGRSGP